ncbi:MAG TPA: PIN domain nuclease [Deltaproteobacteria bacterium]|nr:MAG: hypothetical protein A2048_09395 [Deltaproteobacteria bacterium GWA2_45_12]HBF12666.1 PIN domain nuclease [Deltaproteobacteria bacterium]
MPVDVIIDTNIWIDFFGNESDPTLETILSEGRGYLTPIIVSELISGCRNVKDEEQIISLIRDLPVIDCPLDHWERVGYLRRLCQKKGINLTIPDAHIAQCTLDMDGLLLTRDQVFIKAARVIGLRLF